RQWGGGGRGGGRGHSPSQSRRGAGFPARRPFAMRDERDTSGPEPRVIRIETREPAATAPLPQPRVIRTEQTGNIVAVQPAQPLPPPPPAKPPARRSAVKLGIGGIAVALVGGVTIQAAPPTPAHF